MLYRQFVGVPERPMPVTAVYLGETMQHRSTGTEWIRWYADAPVSLADREEYEAAVDRVTLYNGNPLAIWQ